MPEAAIPDHLAEIALEIEADTFGRFDDLPAEARVQGRANLFGQYIAAAAELLAGEIGAVRASAVMLAKADELLAQEVRRRAPAKSPAELHPMLRGPHG